MAASTKRLHVRLSEADVEPENGLVQRSDVEPGDVHSCLVGRADDDDGSPSSIQDSAVPSGSAISLPGHFSKIFAKMKLEILKIYAQLFIEIFL